MTGAVVLHLTTQFFHWLFTNAAPISSLMAAAGVLGAVRIYHKRAALERAKWLSSLYSRFYEAPDLKAVRRVLDERPPEHPEVEEMVRSENQDFTDYLNFFEFMAYLEYRGELKNRDVAALFEYYLRLLSKHQKVREYVLKEQNGYGYLKALVKRFGWVPE